MKTHSLTRSALALVLAGAACLSTADSALAAKGQQSCLKGCKKCHGETG